MKKKIKIIEKGKVIEKEVNYIPVRYIVAIFLTILEIILVIASVGVLGYFFKWFRILILLTTVGVVIAIIGSNENPDYKIPWLLFVIVLPIVGFMLYFLFHGRKLPKKIVKRYNKFDNSLNYQDKVIHEKLKHCDPLIATQANQLCKISNSHLYRNTKITYYPLGENMHQAIIDEIQKAKKFIFLEFFIIEEGIFWGSILDVLKEKASKGIEVKLVYDDIGCMNTLPGKYYKDLKKYGIDAIPFSILKGQADGEFNNRSHRKILVIDGNVAFTGGVNIADEYINKINRFGHWKDTGIKLVGEAVNELTRLFLTDYYINIKRDADIDFKKYYVSNKEDSSGYVIPFGDGPYPIYEKNVGKSVIMNLLNHAKEYVYITTPYLIIDNELMKCIENASLRGVDVRIIIPHIPDKKLVFEMTKSNCQELIKTGVKIYEYLPGFIHAKSYVADDKVGMIGTINLDYRSLTHHFENGVWIYGNSVIMDIKNDFIETQSRCICINDTKIKDNLINKVIRSIVRIFSPLL